MQQPIVCHRGSPYTALNATHRVNDIFNCFRALNVPLFNDVLFSEGDWGALFYIKPTSNLLAD
jgi:hypothetical protein